jgi:putative isomerase
MIQIKVKRSFVLSLLTIILWATQTHAQPSEYSALQQKLCKGWNTWSYGSMASHVLLPEGLALKVNLRQANIGTPRDNQYFMHEFVVNNDGMVQPIAHTFDGAYTEFLVNNWKGNTIRIQSVTGSDNTISILVTPEGKQGTPYTVELETGIMWNRAGNLESKGNFINASFAKSSYQIRSTSTQVQNIYPYLTPSMVCKGGTEMAFYTGAEKSLDSIKTEIAQANQRYLKYAERYGDKAEAFLGIQTALGWNTLYDVQKDRIVTPVTRGWNEAWQGSVLFNWDTYFAALLYSLDNKEYAYATVFSVTNGNPLSPSVQQNQYPGKTGIGGMTQPPVGSMVCWMIYEKYKEKWFLKEVYDKLLSWNRWWLENRLNKGFLAWGGSSLHNAALESGLDNSPMYEDENMKMLQVGKNSLMNLADVGLNSMYAMDCQFLAKIAKELGKPADEKELLARATLYKDQVQKLWSEKDGIFLNKHTDTDQFAKRLSPTLFYPMLAGIPTQKQVDRMLKDHYFNPSEFYGKYIIPSCPYNDPNYNNDYWRGSIWGPMNLLVYLGLKEYNPKAANELAERSYQLYLKAWKENHLVLENINSEKGVDNLKDQKNADPLYHWGALMGIMKFLENK